MEKENNNERRKMQNAFTFPPFAHQKRDFFFSIRIIATAAPHQAAVGRGGMFFEFLFEMFFVISNETVFFFFSYDQYYLY